jgi:hypothetical protein
MEIHPVSPTTTVIQFFSLLAVVIAFAIPRWLRAREIARSLGRSSQFRPKWIGVEGPLTKADAERARLQENIPSIQPVQQPAEAGFNTEGEKVGDEELVNVPEAFIINK